MISLSVLPALLPSAIPSPSTGVLHLGPFPLRAYAFAILAGIAVATWMARKRWVERGGAAETVLEIVFWAVPFGIVGGRIYHVISSPEAYFGAAGDPIKALYIWEGGLGIWGAIALGGVGAWIGCRKQGVRFGSFADTVAPALLVAQAIGRLGNWFNQELFGGPTTLPWGLRIDPTSATFPAGYAPDTLFHPTFLYELIWNLAAAALLIYLDRRFRLGHGRVFWLYVVLYTTGRLWIELLRIDPAVRIDGVRINVWTSIVVGLGALITFIVLSLLRPGREPSVSLVPAVAGTDGVDLDDDADHVESSEDDDHDEHDEHDEHDDHDEHDTAESNL